MSTHADMRHQMPDRGVLASKTWFAHFRTPGGLLALVAHDSAGAWVTAPFDVSPDLDNLLRYFSVGGRAPVLRTVRDGADVHGWVGTRLKLDDYLVMLVGWAQDLAPFAPTVRAQMLTDIWNGAGAIARQQSDWATSDESNDPPCDFLPGRVADDARVEDLGGLSPSLVPGGFTSWRASVPRRGLEDHREIAVGAEMIISRVVFSAMIGRQSHRWDWPVVSEAQSALDDLESMVDPIAFLEGVRRVERHATAKSIRLLEQEIDATEDHRREERMRRRRAELGLQGGRRVGPVGRFRNWLAVQIRRLG